MRRGRKVFAIVGAAAVLGAAACNTQEMRERGVEENAAKGWDSAGNAVYGPAAAAPVTPATAEGAGMRADSSATSAAPATTSPAQPPR